MYSFLFDRRSLYLLLAGVLTAGCLLFVSGLLVGVFYGLPGGAQVAASPPPACPAVSAQSALSEARAARPCPPAQTVLFDGEPVPLFAGRERSGREDEAGRRDAEDLAEALAQRETGERLVSAPAVGARDADPATRSAAPAPRTPSREPVELPPIEALRATFEQENLPSPVAEPEATGERQTAVAEAPAPVAEPAPALKPAQRAALPAARYSLQVGAYREAENSAKAVESLLDLGYDAYEVREGKGRTLRSVRVGRFADFATAQRAADDFRQREGREVIIRTVGL